MTVAGTAITLRSNNLSQLALLICTYSVGGRPLQSEDMPSFRVILTNASFDEPKSHSISQELSTRQWSTSGHTHKGTVEMPVLLEHRVAVKD